MTVSKELQDQLRQILKQSEPQLTDKQLDQIVSDCVSLVPILAQISQNKKKTSHDRHN